MRYAHFSDVHIGSWRDQKMAYLSTLAFSKAVDECIRQDVDFILISGDIFNTSMPPIDKLKQAVVKLKHLKDRHIPVYIIAGSHDFSPSGKTMLDVIEEAGLWVNVVRGEVIEGKLRLRFTIDQKTGAKITGMIGKKGMLERKYYEELDRESLEQETGYKIFMFHTSITELKPKELELMESYPISLLPKQFNYYAGGHIHTIKRVDIDGYGPVTYPGALFPANFRELEQYGCGGMYLIEADTAAGTTTAITWQPIELYKTLPLCIDCTSKTPDDVEKEIEQAIKGKDLHGMIVLLRIKGRLSLGSMADISFNALFGLMHQQGAYVVMRNTAAVSTPEFEEIKVQAGHVDEIEDKLIQEHLGQVKIEGMPVETEKRMTISLLKALDIEKDEGERVMDVERRVKEHVELVLKEEQIPCPPIHPKA